MPEMEKWGDTIFPLKLPRKLSSVLKRYVDKPKCQAGGEGMNKPNFTPVSKQTASRLRYATLGGFSVFCAISDNRQKSV